jgi:hypothetical protein
MLIRDPGSLRDPEGVVLHDGNRVFRALWSSSADRFSDPEFLSLLDGLVSDGRVIGWRLLPAQQWPDPAELPQDTRLLVEHPLVPFVSYPYEWPFILLKRAALEQLELLRECLKRDFILKDASAFNSQFINGRPTFIDLTSIVPYESGMPWTAYAQFCRHFLNPLLLTAYTGVDFQPLLRARLDGIEPDEVARLLPLRAGLRPAIFVHVTMQRLLGKWMGQLGSEMEIAREAGKAFSRQSIDRLAAKLHRTIAGLEWRPARNAWLEYERQADYKAAAVQTRQSFVTEAIEFVKPASVWDFGANVGSNTLLAADAGRCVVGFDREHACADFLQRRAAGAVLSLVMDLTNPSPVQGFAENERPGLAARGPADLLLALAFIHHLALGAGLALEAIVKWFGRLCRFAVLEFVPAHDRRAAALIERRGAPNGEYSQASFLALLERSGKVHRLVSLPESSRTLVLWEPQPCQRERNPAGTRSSTAGP